MDKVRGVILSPNGEHILLIKRAKRRRRFYVFPGGSIESGEDETAALKREVLEETSLPVEIVRRIYVSASRSGRFGRQAYYLCQAPYQSPHLSTMSDEFKANSAANSYEPVWVALDEVGRLRLFPKAIRRRLLSDLSAANDEVVAISEP